MVVDHPSHAFLQRLAPEIDEQPDRLLDEPKIRQQLPGMYRQQLLNGLYLDDQPTVDQQTPPERRARRNECPPNAAGRRNTPLSPDAPQ